MIMKTINLKSLRIIFAVLFAFPLFFSCKSDDEDVITYYDTYIDGYITDYNTGAPVKELSLMLIISIRIVMGLGLVQSLINRKM